MSNTPLTEALASLISLKENLPSLVKEIYIYNYHSILSDLEAASGFDLTKYRILPDHLKQKGPIEPWRPLRRQGAQRKSEPPETYCPRPYFLMQIDAVLLLFTYPEEKRPIGFRPPQ